MTRRFLAPTHLAFPRHLCALALSLASLLPTAAAEPPNIIFILTDDLGYNQIGANGETPILTPHLDKLAESGLRFTNAYAGNTVCSPSRVALFTGRDGRLMADNSNKVQLRDIDVTFAQVLKHASYDTSLFGKYSIGSQMGVTDPLAMGFDTWFGMYSILEGHRQYPTILWRDGVQERVKANEGGQKGEYAQRRFTDEAISYLKEKREDPFFLFLSYSSPHAELAAPKEYLDLYQDRFQEVPYLGVVDGEPSDKYAWYYPEPVADPFATTAAMISALDAYVGEIVATLKAQGLWENTILIFTSDNGPHDEGGASPDYFHAASPYRGMKRDLYDGGIHVPLILSWPAKITQARVDETPLSFADFLPTFADLAGVNLDLVPRVKTNGVSLAGRLGDEPEALPERLIYWEFGKQAGDPNSGIVGEIFQAARRGPWKAVRYGVEGEVELYNLTSDTREEQNLAAEKPELHAEFTKLFQEELAD